MYTKILCGVDFTHTSHEAVKTAGCLAATLGAKIVLAHVIPPDPYIPETEAMAVNLLHYRRSCIRVNRMRLRVLATRLIPKTVQREIVVLEGQPAQMLNQLAERDGVDLIVVATHGMTGWRHYMVGSVALKIIQNTTIPVLVVHSPAIPDAITAGAKEEKNSTLPRPEPETSVLSAQSTVGPEQL